MPAPDQPAIGASDEIGMLDRDLFLRRLFEIHQAALMRFVAGRIPRRDAAADVVQEVFLRIARQEQLDSIKENPRAYLYRVAINIIRDQNRRDRVRRGEMQPGIDGVNLELVASDEATPEEHCGAREELRNVREAILGMPMAPRRVFLLHRFGGLEHREIAAMLGISLRSVERQMALALEHLLDKRLRWR